MTQLLALLKALGSANFAALVPLLLQLIKLIKSGGSIQDVITLVMQIISLLVPNVPPVPVPPTPTPGPNPVFGVAASASDESQFVSEAVAAGCSEADAKELVEVLR